MRQVVTLRYARAILCATLPWAFAAAGSASDNPWQVLDSLRRNLESSPLEASFEQRFRPAGFSSTDRESGRLLLSLPRCVRWEYDPPDSKSFLLCDTTIYTWVEGDAAGRRFELEGTSEPGIDLLRLRLEDLELRYDATLQQSVSGGHTISLTPKSAQSPLTEASLTVDASLQYLETLAYTDRDGNYSEFDIEDYRDLDQPSAFAVPADIEWLSD